MYCQNYEDYMRSVLGYPTQNEYTSYTYNSQPYESEIYSMQIDRYSDEIINLYPDIYKLINPMVCKICESNTKPITKELIEKMTEEIYLNIESVPEMTNTVDNVRVNITKDNDKSCESNKSISQNKMETRTQHSEDRHKRPNDTLSDLIRILILNKLLGIDRPPRPIPPRHPRPPFPPHVGRPPFSRENIYYSDI